MKLLCKAIGQNFSTSRPARGAWVEICVERLLSLLLRSRPTRGAWVEIRRRCLLRKKALVAPREGRVG